MICFVIRVMVFNQHIFSVLASSQLTTNIHWPFYYAVHAFVVIHFCDSMIDTNTCRFCLIVFYVCISMWDPVINWEQLWPHLLVKSRYISVPNQDMEFERHMSCFSWFIISGVMWLLGLLILVALLTIRIKFSFHNYVVTYVSKQKRSTIIYEYYLYTDFL